MPLLWAHAHLRLTWQTCGSLAGGKRWGAVSLVLSPRGRLFPLQSQRRALATLPGMLNRLATQTENYPTKAKHSPGLPCAQGLSPAPTWGPEGNVVGWTEGSHPLGCSPQLHQIWRGYETTLSFHCNLEDPLLLWEVKRMLSFRRFLFLKWA